MTAGEVVLVHLWDDDSRRLVPHWITWDQFHELLRPLEEGARRRIAAMPRCSTCGEPMTCGQYAHHHSCEP